MPGCAPPPHTGAGCINIPRCYDYHRDKGDTLVSGRSEWVIKDAVRRVSTEGVLRGGSDTTRRWLLGDKVEIEGTLGLDTEVGQ